MIKTTISRLLDRLTHTRVRLAVTCPHGEFIPASYRAGANGRIGCRHCPMQITVTWLHHQQDT